MRLELLEDLYRHKLAELYDAEKQGLRFLPKLAQALPKPEWQQLLTNHLEESRSHCQRLEQLMATRGVQEHRKSKAMSGIIAEAREVLKEDAAEPELLGLALASAAQDIEGHEITCYASAHTYARLLSFHPDLKPLEQTFQEEKRMEDRLAAFAESLGLEERDIETSSEPAKSHGA